MIAQALETISARELLEIPETVFELRLRAKWHHTRIILSVDCNSYGEYFCAIVFGIGLIVFERSD
jgi:hypothetical protein